MKHTKKAWTLGEIALRLTGDGNTVWFEEDAEGGNLLSSLAQLRLEAVSSCALDVLFSYGYRFAHTADALRAYALFPLSKPPKESLQAFAEIDWSVPQPQHNLKAVLLAGMGDASSIELLLNILEVAEEDSRDGPLYACAAHHDHRVLSAVAKLAMSVREADSLATGELRAFAFCIGEWLRRNAIGLDGMSTLLLENTRGERGYMSYKRLLNFAFSFNWRDVPFPGEGNQCL